jgi:hypothetical protein
MGRRQSQQDANDKGRVRAWHAYRFNEIVRAHRDVEAKRASPKLVATT